MEQHEIEMLVAELESRIDRLRSLYDMYFMGIERLEPLVPRKDVERRMAALRKEQIRNTGLRFKFNVIIQRFNTYQTYWLRIARQIEQGTYRRDVMRATARFGVDPTKERAASAPPPLPPEPEEFGDFEVSLEDLEDGTEFLQSLAAEHDPFADLGPPAAPAPSARERFASVVRLDLDDLADPFEEQDPFPKPPIPSVAAPKIRIAPRAGGASLPAPSTEPMGQDTERRIPVATAPRIAMRSGSPPAQAQGSVAPPSSPRLNEAPRVIVAKRPSIPDDLERSPSARPAVPSPPPSNSSIPRAGLPTAGSPPRAGPAANVSLPVPRPSVGPTPPGSVPRLANAGVGGASLPASSAAGAPRVVSRAVVPSASVSSPPAAVSKPIPASSASSPGAPPRATPAAAAPPAAPPPAAPVPVRAPPAAPVAAAPAPVPAAPPATRIGDLSGDRFGQIFSKYVETRRERNEPTHAITREALARQLSESTERLKQKHGGKAIDFEVVVKDGKTILRPVVK